MAEEQVIRVQLKDGSGTAVFDDCEEVKALLKGRMPLMHRGKLCINLPATLNPSGKKGLVIMHCLLMKDFGFVPGKKVYHMDGDEYNVRRSNLRVVDASGYVQLKRTLGVPVVDGKETTSGVSGIYRSSVGNRWIVDFFDATRNRHQKSFNDLAYNGDSKLSFADAKKFMEDKDEENKQRLLQKYAQPAVRQEAVPPPAAAEPVIQHAMDVARTMNYVLGTKDGVLEVALTHGRVMLLDDIPQVWELLRTHRFAYSTSHNGVVYAACAGKKIHIMLKDLIPGDGPQVDHINGNGLDNRIANLRRVTQSVNKRNHTSAYRNSKTGITGLHRHNASYTVSVTTDEGKTEYVGTFSFLKYGSEEIARLAAIERLEQVRGTISAYRLADQRTSVHMAVAAPAAAAAAPAPEPVEAVVQKPASDIVQVTDEGAIVISDSDDDSDPMDADNPPTAQVVHLPPQKSMEKSA